MILRAGALTLEETPGNSGATCGTKAVGGDRVAQGDRAVSNVEAIGCAGAIVMMQRQVKDWNKSKANYGSFLEFEADFR